MCIVYEFTCYIALFARLISLTGSFYCCFIRLCINWSCGRNRSRGLIAWLNVISFLYLISGDYLLSVMKILSLVIAWHIIVTYVSHIDCRFVLLVDKNITIHIVAALFVELYIYSKEIAKIFNQYFFRYIII
jgi:hypothetical protein